MSEDKKDFDDFIRSLSATPVGKEDEQIEQLQEQLAGERDARKEDQFIFIVICVVLLDVVFFSVLDNFSGPLALLFLQLLVLLPLARKLGMENIEKLIDGFLSRIKANFSGDD